MSSKKHFTIEEAKRIGEALALKWTDVDFERHVMLVNNTEKGGKPIAFKISGKLIAMIDRREALWEDDL